MALPHVSQSSISLPTRGTEAPEVLPLISLGPILTTPTPRPGHLSASPKQLFSLALSPLTGLRPPQPALGRALPPWIVHHASNSTGTGHNSSPTQPLTPPEPRDHPPPQHQGKNQTTLNSAPAIHQSRPQPKAPHLFNSAVTWNETDIGSSPSSSCCNFQ